MPAILILVIAAILHVSLYPWRFQSAPAGTDAIASFFASGFTWSTARGVFDASANLALYFPLGVFGYLTFKRRAALFTLLLGTILSLAVEFLQIFSFSRYVSAADTIANVFGTALGVSAAAVLRDRLHIWSRARPQLRAGAALLLICWLAYHTYPFMPETSLYLLRQKIANLANPGPFRVQTMVSGAGEWLAAAILLGTLIPRRFVILAALVLPAHFLISMRTVEWHEAAAAAIGVAASYAFGRRTAILIALASLAGNIAFVGLMPGPSGVGPGRFQWIPLVPVLVGPAVSVKIIMLLKAFRYGSLVWLLREAGLTLPVAGAAAAGFLFAIEWMQTLVPGHVPEITDPLIALAAMLVLRSVDRQTAVRERPRAAA